MTLAVVGSTASIASGTSGAVTPAVPDGSVGDAIIWVVGWGTSAAASITDRPTTSGGPGDLAHLGSVFGGGGAYGTDTGPRGFSCWTATATSETGATDNVAFTNSATGTAGTRTLGAVAIRLSKAAGKLVSWAFAGGTDATGGDAWAPTGQTDVGCTAGDVVFGTLVGVPQATNPTPTLAWPGCTLGTQANTRTGAVSSGAGMRMNTRQATPITGGPSSGAPTGGSATTGLSGVMGFMRARETDPPAASNTGAFLALI